MTSYTSNAHFNNRFTAISQKQSFRYVIHISFLYYDILNSKFLFLKTILFTLMHYSLYGPVSNVIPVPITKLQGKGFVLRMRIENK